MATYRVLYWHELPAQVKAEGEGGTANLPLDAEFTERIDKLAMQRGLFGTDEYLDGWRWSDPEERPGTAQQVAEAVRKELEEAAD